MENTVIIYMTILAILVLMLMAFAVFAIGFIVGYKKEEKRVLTRKQSIEASELQDSEKEKKAKKDWKKFLEYDGSTPIGYE